jgi:hypothetical protein
MIGDSDRTQAFCAAHLNELFSVSLALSRRDSFGTVPICISGSADLEVAFNEMCAFIHASDYSVLKNISEMSHQFKSQFVAARRPRKAPAVSVVGNVALGER